jgi:ATP-dependent protease HslVU (ClpYQ) peptidase subunit
MVEHETGVTIGFDSRVSVGYTYSDLEADKVFANNGIVFGVAGAVLDAQIMQYADLPNPEDGGWDTDKWVTNELVPALMDAMDNRGALERYAGKIESNSHSLIVVRRRVYELFAGGAWIRRVSGKYAIGSGSQFAMGAMEAKVPVQHALEIAAQHDSGTGNRIRVIDLDELLGA